LLVYAFFGKAFFLKQVSSRKAGLRRASSKVIASTANLEKIGIAFLDKQKHGIPAIFPKQAETTRRKKKRHELNLLRIVDCGRRATCGRIAD
jgi:hypothetical protein